MIIETKDDVVKLSGSLHKNQWMTIKAAVNLLIHEHPEGIVVDCADLQEVSEDGARTFLEAMRDIEAAKARIIVACLPDNVKSVLKTIPGVRSQLPVADTLEDARASLRVHRQATPAANGEAGKHGPTILVPLISELDLSYGANLAARLSRATRADIRLIYFLEVVRNLPLNAPLMEEERSAQAALGQAMQYCKQQNAPAMVQIERVREATDGLLTAVKTYNADMIVIGAAIHPAGEEGHEAFRAMVQTLLQRAPCEVVVGRLKPPL